MGLKPGALSAMRGLNLFNVQSPTAVCVGAAGHRELAAQGPRAGDGHVGPHHLRVAGVQRDVDERVLRSAEGELHQASLARGVAVYKLRLKAQTLETSFSSHLS
jgi:hypothetical protein